MKTSFLAGTSDLQLVRSICKEWGVGLEKVFNAFLWEAVKMEIDLKPEKKVSSKRNIFCVVIEPFVWEKTVSFCKEKDVMRSRFLRAVMKRIGSARPDEIFQKLQAFAIEKKIQEALNG